MRPVPGLGVTIAAVKGTSARTHVSYQCMKLIHLLVARHCARQSSVVVNGVFFRTRKPTVLTPSTPQSSAADEEGEGVDDGAVDVASAGVIEMSEDSLEDVEMEVDVEDPLEDDELE